MEGPLDLRLYYSSRLDELGPYCSAHAQRVEGLLAATTPNHDSVAPSAAVGY